MTIRITVGAAGGSGLRTLEDVVFAEKLGSLLVFIRKKTIEYLFIKSFIFAGIYQNH